MKRLIITLLFWVPLLTFASDSEAILKSFQNYKSAILDQKGEIATGLVTKRTVDEYQNYVDWALSGDRKTLESLSFINRFQVFLLKHRIPVETLKKLDGRSAFAYAVDRDWIGKNGTIRTTLGKVDVAGNRATAEVLIGGQTAPNRFQFTKENGVWKFDLIQVMRDTDQALKAVARQKGKSEQEFMFSLIETVSGRKVEDTIWTPIQKKIGKDDSASGNKPVGSATNRTPSATGSPP